MSPPIKIKTTIDIPPGLVPQLDLLVTEYALAMKEEPSACRRAVEIAVLQRGVAAVREGLKA